MSDFVVQSWIGIKLNLSFERLLEVIACNNINLVNFVFKHSYNILIFSIFIEFPRSSVEGYTKRNISGWCNGHSISYSDYAKYTKQTITNLVQSLLKAENKNDFLVIGNNRIII